MDIMFLLVVNYYELIHIVGNYARDVTRGFSETSKIN